jgi:hypothetical protein
LKKDSDGKIKYLHFSSYLNDGSPISIAMGTLNFGDQSETAKLAPQQPLKWRQQATTTLKMTNLTPRWESAALQSGESSIDVWEIPSSLTIWYEYYSASAWQKNLRNPMFGFQ